LLDKDKVRIGNGVLVVDDLNPGESARVQFQCTAVGVPVQLSISTRNVGGVPTSLKTIPLNVISVPAGASLKVDGKDEGLTPAKINVTAGAHQLELRKEGFAIATTPLDVAPDEAPGGSITITLGGLANDTIELRDGSILTGDVISMSLESVVVNVRGSEQTFDRNKIKKIFLIERTVTHITVPEAPAKANPPTTDSQTPHP
jgi:PEGA domain